MNNQAMIAVKVVIVVLEKVVGGRRFSQGYRKWIYALKIYRTNCLPSDSLDLEILVICPIVRFFVY